MRELNPAQEKFCLLYHETGNASQSYKDAYGVTKDSTSKKNSNRLLKQPYIKARLKELQDAVKEKYDMSIDKIIRKNVDIAFSKLSNVIEIVDGEIRLLDDGDIDQLDGISFSKSESSSSTDKSDTESKSTSISVRRPDRIKALQEILDTFNVKNL